MSNSMPLRWIAEVEAREVLAAARFERAAGRSWCVAAADRVRGWLAAPDERASWGIMQAQPALARVRRPVRAAESADSQRYCRW